MYLTYLPEEVLIMSKIKSLSVLRNCIKVFDELKQGEPILFTKIGDEVGTLVNSKDWLKLQTKIRLLKSLSHEDNQFSGSLLNEFRKRHDRNHV